MPSLLGEQSQSTHLRMPPLSRKPALRQALGDPDSFASILLVILVDSFGMESLNWHPSTIRQELEEEFALQLPKGASDRLMAAITVVTTDLFYTDLPAFVQVCNVLAGSEFNPAAPDIADVMECAWGIAEGMLLDPPELPDLFTDDIRRYLGAVLDHEGYLFTPKILSPAIREETRDTLYSWSDDPEFFKSIHQNQQTTANEVDQTVTALLGELVQSLVRLPLQTVSGAELQKRLAAGLTKSK